jgi:signal transduction histidine kinase
MIETIELAVKSETTLYQTMYEKAPIGVAVLNNQGIVVWMNQLGKGFLNIEAIEGQVLLQSKDWPVFRSLLLQEKPFSYQLDEQCFLFTPHPVILEEEKRIILWIVPSVSMNLDFLEMQRDLIQQRKLANLGRMMTEMAHELNNPLAGISMASQLVAMSLKKLKKLISSNPVQTEAVLPVLEQINAELAKITSATARAASLRQEVLTCSRSNMLNLRPHRLDKLLGQIISSFANQPVFKNIHIVQEFSDASPTIHCDASKLEQILYNLIKNAHEAMEGKGQVLLREVIEERHVVILVEDSGPGIPEDLMDKIFSPFLTTKPRTGTGLGLSISKQIIQEHNGDLSVYNRPEGGACFRITFPINEKRS